MKQKGHFVSNFVRVSNFGLFVRIVLDRPTFPTLLKDHGVFCSDHSTVCKKGSVGGGLFVVKGLIEHDTPSQGK